MSLQKTLFYLLLLQFNNIKINAQDKKEKILWNSYANIPVQYATIKSDNESTISNETGFFTIDFKTGKLIVQNLSYQNIEIDLDYYKSNDTIFMKPKVYELEEVVIVKNTKFNNMLKAIPTDYALEPHQEKFFLRAIIKKNNEFYKIVDFSGVLEKNTLFTTSLKPKQKINYRVQVNNIRKVGLEDKTYDFELFSYDTFLKVISSIYLSPEIYNLSYKDTNDDRFSKIILKPKDSSVTKTDGYYFIDNLDNTFNEVYSIYQNKKSLFAQKRDVKYRTIFFEKKSNFKRNENTNKYQLNLAILKSHTEVVSNNKEDFFEVTYVYYAVPVSNFIKLKNNINIKEDMFELNIKYDNAYWDNHDVLPLTAEMQDFINKVNSSNNKSDFRTKTNMNKNHNK